MSTICSWIGEGVTVHMQVLHSLHRYGTLVPGYGGVMAGQEFGFVCRSGHAVGPLVGASMTIA